MSINNSDLIIIFAPAGVDTKLLTSDLAGRPLIDYLIENVAVLGIRVKLIVLNNYDELYALLVNRDDIDLKVWQSGVSLDELLDYPLREGVLLLLDVRTFMFSSLTIERLLEKKREKLNSLKIIEGKYVDTYTIAQAISGEKDWSDILTFRFDSQQSNLNELLCLFLTTQSDVICTKDIDEFKPPVMIRDFVELAQVERQVLNQRAIDLMKQGVRIRNPETVEIRGELLCGREVEIDVNVIIKGKVSLADGVKVGSNSILIRSEIGERTEIKPYSIVEDAVVGADSFVGPYGRVLRPGSTLGDRVQLGNFVEIKSSYIASGCRINHLSFIGDADLAENVTVGAGTITCNYDGIGVNHTVVEEGVTIGSGCNLVAPIEIGSNATIGAGSTITSDVPKNKLTLGWVTTNN